jgi:prepilin-type N-terminal cleavage/methylation domain-containing protein
MRRLNSSAFSMIEVAIAIAVIAILAGAVAPLALKALNQQREQKTRDNLKIAWEAIFGARDHRTSNMLGDFNFDPLTMSLTTMVTRPGAVRAYATYATNPDLSGGWNGPYWTGTTTAAGTPADGWGNAFVLRRVGANWQLLSYGANGAPNTPAGNGTPQGDDLAYPVPPQALPTAALSVNVSRVGGYAASGIITVACASTGTGIAPVSTPIAIATTSGSTAIHPGRAVITATILAQPAYPPLPATAIIPATLASQSQSQIVDILPGGSSVVSFTFQ